MKDKSTPTDHVFDLEEPGYSITGRRVGGHGAPAALAGATPKGGKTGARKNGSAEADPKVIPDRYADFLSFD